MSDQTSLLNELTVLFHAYAPRDIVKAAPITAAFANNVYDITDSSGQRYVIKALKMQLPETVEREAIMQRRLIAAGIGSPQYLKINGSYVGEQNGVKFILSNYIEGKTPVTASLALVKDFGATLAKLHMCLEGMQIPSSKMQWFDPRMTKIDLAAYYGPLKADLTQLVGTSEKLFSLGLPKAVIHADLWLGNVFAKGDKITAVFDLETAQYTLRILDLARTYLSMRLETDHPAKLLIQALFEGYDATAAKPLTPAEKDNFGLAAAYGAGVCGTWNALHATEYAAPYVSFGKETL